MVRPCAMPLTAVLLLIGHPLVGGAKAREATLAEAVKEFNERAQKNPTGMTQPVLTEDEAVAAIRGWIREQAPATDDVYKSYQVIADTKQLPEGATLTFTTTWSPFNGQELDVWWVNVNLKTGPNTGFTFRLRDQKLRCRPVPR